MPVVARTYKRVNVASIGCGFDSDLSKPNIQCFNFFAPVSRQNETLRLATQHAASPEIGEKWKLECLNT